MDHSQDDRPEEMNDDRFDDELDAAQETRSQSGDGTLSMSSMFGSASEVVEQYCHCVLCGSNLHFSHMTDFSRNLTQETAKCPECGVKVRNVLHRLQ